MTSKREEPFQLLREKEREIDMPVTVERRGPDYGFYYVCFLGGLFWKHALTAHSYQPAAICAFESLGDGHLLWEDALGALESDRAFRKLWGAEARSCCSHFSLMLHVPLLLFSGQHGRQFEREESI